MSPLGCGVLAWLVALTGLGLVPGVVAWLGYGLAIAGGACLAVLLLALALALFEGRG
jgi:hypothetical protein